MEQWLNSLEIAQSRFGEPEAAENVQQVSQSSSWRQRGSIEGGH